MRSRKFVSVTAIRVIPFKMLRGGIVCFKASDLSDQEAVKLATKEYQEESDRIGQFVDAWLEEGEGYEVRSSAAYMLYGEWCDKYGYRKENSTNFNNAIKRFFPIQRKRPNCETDGPTTMLIGCRFLEERMANRRRRQPPSDDVLGARHTDIGKAPAA